MRLLVAGASGQLAHALVERSRRLDGVTVDRARAAHSSTCSIRRASPAPSNSTRPDVVVNAAAYTAVDKAESDAAAAFALNRDGAGALAAAAAAAGCPIIHVSTDYVFDGTKSGAYRRGRTRPIRWASTAAPSSTARRRSPPANARHVILRTAWVYGAHGHNFLKTMLRLARERPELRVVADQRGNPTYAPHLADAILAIAAQIGSGQPWGIYHATAAGETTWHGFASAIIAAAKPLGVPQIPVLPITTADYPTPARRPANSCLDCGKLERVFGVRLPPWQHGLAECIGELA